MHLDPLQSVTIDASTRALLSRLYREYVRVHMKTVLLSIGCMALSSGATIALAWLVEPILDDVFTGQDTSMIVPLALVLVVIGMLRGAGVFGQSLLMAKASNEIIRTLRMEIFANLMRADLALFQSTSTGNLISRIMSDVAVVRSTLASTFVAAGRDVLTMTGLIGLMFYQNWRLAILALFGIPIVVLIVVHLGRRMRRLSRELQNRRGKFTTLLDETFRGARIVKSYGMENYETNRAVRGLDEIYRFVMKQVKTSAIVHPVIETILGFGMAFVVTYGGYQVIAGTITTGAFFSFIAALILCNGPVRRLTQLNIQVQNGLAAAQRVFEMIDLEPTIVDRPDALALRADEVEIRFDNVRFAYVDDQAALDCVTLTIPAGKTAALVGPSGAGKSTVINLIPRFYDVEDGAVRINGHDVRDLSMDSLRAAISLVSQEVSLFDDTVRANIAYGRPDASETDIVEAACHVGADEFIRNLPDGYDTVVGGRGERLSGGQRQRIAIARAMLKNAPILLLDEATSSLDTESERQIQAALGKLMQGRTTLIVAHRLSTIVHADIIYVIDEGRIVESGSHQELVDRGNLYARLQTAQTRPIDAERVERRARA